MYTKKPVGTSDQSGTGLDKQHRQKDPWKYIKPKDLQQPVIFDNKKWFFCRKCKCRATGKIGFYQLLHTDDTHNPNWRPESNSSPVEDPDPTPLPSLRSPDANQIALDNDLVFTGVNCAPVLVETQPHDERETLTSGVESAGYKSASWIHQR